MNNSYYLPVHGHEVAVLPDNPVYAVTDLVFQRGHMWSQFREEILSNRLYKDTIMFDYLSSMKKERDFKTLKSVIKERIDRYSLPGPENTDLVLHVRLGDIMEGVPGPPHEGGTLSKKTYEINRYSKLKDLDTFFIGRNRVSTLKISRVIVVTALHFGTDKSKGWYKQTPYSMSESLKLLNTIKNQVTEMGHEFLIQSNVNIDKDICYMVQSKLFVRGISQLGKLIKLCKL
tara:strand:- start:10750 stop:11442 length:693 start_codon:yes stop_codon:yes gene_type:complete